MQYLVALAAVIGLASAAPIANNNVVKRELGQVQFCTGADGQGDCHTETYPTNTCIVLPEPYNKNILTFIPDAGNLVRLTNSAESCTLHGDLFLETPGSYNLKDYSGGDYSNATSFLIQRCTACV